MKNGLCLLGFKEQYCRCESETPVMIMVIDLILFVIYLCRGIFVSCVQIRAHRPILFVLLLLVGVHSHRRVNEP